MFSCICEPRLCLLVDFLLWVVCFVPGGQTVLTDNTFCMWSRLEISPAAIQAGWSLSECGAHTYCQVFWMFCWSTNDTKHLVERPSICCWCRIVLSNIVNSCTNSHSLLSMLCFATSGHGAVISFWCSAFPWFCTLHDKYDHWNFYPIFSAFTLGGNHRSNQYPFLVYQYFIRIVDQCGQGCSHWPSKFWVLPWDKVQRLGEAKNPGPDTHDLHHDHIKFSIVNPTGLFKKDDLIAALGPGTYSIAETHATIKAQRNMKTAFRGRLINPIFGRPVPPHLGNDTCKGIASGVACLSTYPIRHIPLVGFEALFDTCRIVAAHVNFGPNITCLIVTIYAPPPSSLTIVDPKGLTIQLLECAAHLIRSWKGPAIIAGDFNQNIFQLDVVQNLIHNGWEDGQTLHHRKFGTPIQPTCVIPQGVSNFSNILCSPEIARSFNWCTTTDHSFCGHPVLTLSCHMQVLRQRKVVWKLPKPLECHNFDEHVLEQQSQFYENRSREIQTHLQNGEIEDAAKLWTKITEETLATAARDSHNNPISFSQEHFHRHKGPKFKPLPVAQPITKWGRPGDMQTENLQGPLWHRQHLRQLRRLQTLVNLSRARDREPTESNLSACHQLFDKIVSAPGFKGGFPAWVVLYLHVTWPLTYPSTLELENIYQCFQEYFQKVDRQVAKENREITKSTFQTDWDNGGSLSFKAIREESVQPLCYIAKTVMVRVKKTRWYKQGLTTLYVDTTHNLIENLPVVFQGQHRNIVALTANSVQVDKAVQLRDRSFQLKQVQYLYQPQQASEEVVSTWNMYLQRDDSDDSWDAAERLLPMIPQCPPIEVPPFQVDLWKRIQSKTSVKSARGACGFSVRELRCIPSWLLLLLFSVFQTIESTGVWPQIWVLAFTILLPKTDNPSNALDLRPITILSRVYRLWSRYKAIAIISGLTKIVPKTVAGGTTQMSALLLSGHVQDMLEDPDNLQTLCGLTVDIVKCYNTIPRYPLALFMLRLGWPPEVVKSYMGALFQMRRTFLVLNSASAWQQATTGVPEGCALAVASMLTLSVVLFHYVKHYSPTADVITFADNWSFVFENFEQAKFLIDKIESFCATLRLRLSIPKSWTWALDKSVAEQLNTVQMQGEPIPNHKNVTDLGVDLTYRGRKSKSNLYHRISLGLKRCQAVSKIGGPKSRRPKLIKGSCFPKSSYGCALLHPAKDKFSLFRTETARALGFSRSGSSPWIALNLIPNQCDFELHVVLTTLNFWRQYFLIFPNRKGVVLVKVCSHTFKGTSLALRTALLKLGDINANGHLLTEHFGRIDWTTCSRKFLKYIVTHQWNLHVCKQLQHRKFFSATQTDGVVLNKFCKTLDAPEFFGLCVHLTGAHYTLDAKSKFLEEENVCPLCNSACDSRAHRTLECCALNHLRTSWDDKTWEVAKEPLTSHFGLLELPGEVSKLRLLIPIQSFLPDIPVALKDLTIVRVFVDGTCFHPLSPLTALAAGAVVVVTEYPERSTLKVQRALLPTRDHNSHRAEIYAVLLGLHLGYRLQLYSDCQSVIDTFNQLAFIIRHEAKIPSLDNWDLWEYVYESIKNRVDYVQIIKTKGHDNMHGESQHHWQAWANDVVDKHAKLAVTQDHAALLAKFDHVTKVLECRRCAHVQILKLHIAAANIAFKARNRTTMPDKRNGDKPVDTALHIIPMIPSETLEKCPINPLFLHRLVDWCKTLQWETCQNGETTYLELCLEYIFTNKTYPPLPVPKFLNRTQSNKQWILLDQQQGPYTLEAFTIDQAIQGLSRTSNWLYKSTGILLFPFPTKNQTTPLKRYGFRGHPAGVPCRARLIHSDQIDTWCHKTLCGYDNFKFPIPEFDL